MIHKFQTPPPTVPLPSRGGLPEGRGGAWGAASVLSVIAGLLTLIAGGMIYVLYRPRTLLLFHVADGLGLTTPLAHWRLSAMAFTPPEFVVYSLPAGLWAMSYVLIEGVLVQAFSAQRRWAAVAFVPLLGAASELLQAARLLPGTFDASDLVLYLLPLAVYDTINIKL